MVKCILIASPGFVKDQFYEYMLAEAIKQDIKVLLENKSKFLLVRLTLIWRLSFSLRYTLHQVTSSHLRKSSQISQFW